MRTIDAEAILDAQNNIELTADADESAGGVAGEPTVAPVIDGDFLLEAQLEAIAKCRAGKVSTLIGTMDEEWNLFCAMVAAEPPE